MSTVSDSTQYSNSLKQAKDRYESELAEARARQQKEVETLKKNHSEDLREIKASAREEVRKLKEELYDSNGQRSSREMKAKVEDRATFQGYRESVEKQAEKKVDSVQKHSESRLEASAKENEAKIEEALQAQKHSHAEELKPVLQELSQYRNEARDTESEKAKAKQQVIENYESDHLKEKQNIVDSYEHLVGKMQDQEQNLQDYYAEKLTDASLSTAGKTKKTLEQQRKEFTKVLKDQKNEQQRMEQSYQDELRGERTRHVKSSNQLVDQTREQTSRALKEKDEAFIGYLEKNSKQVRSELKAREDVIRDLTTTTDERKVSPALLNKIHTAEEMRYFEKLKNLQDTEKQMFDAIRSRDFDERAAIRGQFEEAAREAGRDLHRENDLQKRVFFSTYQDLKDLHESEMRQAEGKSKQAVAKLSEGHAREVMQGQKVNRVALQEQRDSLRDEKDHAIQDLSLDQKLRDREWFLKVNDQRREFEKRLTHERDLHERSMLEQKAEFERKIHDQERTAKRILDEKDRTLIAQTKQQEMVHKEKERFLVEHYEEELDKMKHTNAQLIEKKS